MRRILAALVGAVRIAFGALDLDDVRAQIGQHHSGAGTGDEGALLDDPDSRQVPAARRCSWSVRSLGYEAGRRLAVVIDRLRGGVRHHEADRPLLLLEQMRDQPGGARQHRHALEGQQRISRIQQHRRNRAGDVQRQRACRSVPAAAARPRVRSARGGRVRAALRRRPRTGAARADRNPCAADARIRGSRAWRSRYSRTTARALDSSELFPAASRACNLGQEAPAASDEPSTTEPQPRMPAATAPCSASGAAARVMRDACTLGTRPCSAMATSVASSTRRCAAEGSAPVTSSQKCSVKLMRADKLAGQIAAAHDDGVCVRRRDGRTALVLSPDLQKYPLAIISLYRKLWSIFETILNLRPSRVKKLHEPLPDFRISK